MVAENDGRIFKISGVLGMAEVGGKILPVYSMGDSVGRYSFGDIATVPYEMAGVVHKAGEDAID